jgi:hypothetical protein
MTWINPSGAGYKLYKVTIRPVRPTVLRLWSVCLHGIPRLSFFVKFHISDFYKNLFTHCDVSSNRIKITANLREDVRIFTLSRWGVDSCNRLFTVRYALRSKWKFRISIQQPSMICISVSMKRRSLLIVTCGRDTENIYIAFFVTSGKAHFKYSSLSAFLKTDTTPKFRDNNTAKARDVLQLCEYFILYFHYVIYNWCLLPNSTGLLCTLTCRKTKYNGTALTRQYIIVCW